jgi:hypothetical protein
VNGSLHSLVCSHILFWFLEYCKIQSTYEGIRSLHVIAFCVQLNIPIYLFSLAGLNCNDLDDPISASALAPSPNLLKDVAFRRALLLKPGIRDELRN